MLRDPTTRPERRLLRPYRRQSCGGFENGERIFEDSHRACRSSIQNRSVRSAGQVESPSSGMAAFSHKKLTGMVLSRLCANKMGQDARLAVAMLSMPTLLTRFVINVLTMARSGLCDAGYFKLAAAKYRTAASFVVRRAQRRRCCGARSGLAVAAAHSRHSYGLCDEPRRDRHSAIRPSAVAMAHHGS